MASEGIKDFVLATANQTSDEQSVLIEIEPSKAGSSTPLVLTESFPHLKTYESIEEFNKNLPDTVTILKGLNGSNVYLVGTAHFSEESQKDVALVIRNVRPRAVVVELCESRVHILRHDEKSLLEEAKDINMQKVRNVIKSNGFFNGMFYILLLNMSAKLTKELGMAPGGEFRTAMKEATKIPHCLVHLGDRPIK